MPLSRFAWLPVLVTLTACSPSGEAKALRDGHAAVSQIVLLDVQALFGGQNVFIAGDGTVTLVTVRKPTGDRQTRYVLHLTTAKFKTIQDVIANHDFFAIEIRERPASADEARPSLRVRLSSGADRTVQKWANDKHGDFDALYNRLLALVEQAERTKPVYEGPRDDSWRPAGF